MAEFKKKLSEHQIVNATANVCGAYNYKNRLLLLDDGTTLCARYTHTTSRMILGMYHIICWSFFCRPPLQDQPASLDWCTPLKNFKCII